MRKSVVLLAALGCAACASTPAAPPVNSLPAVTVTAAGETAPVGTAAADAADDPAIWHNAADPGASLIVATDKKAGLYVYGMDGKARFNNSDGRLNNVDLVDMPGKGVIVVASDRNDPLHALLRIYRLDTATAQLLPVAALPGGNGEAYGLCLWNNGANLHAFSVLKDGTIEEYLLSVEGTPAATHQRTRKLATQTEGCVVDPRDGTLYVGEENVGIWRYRAKSTEGELVAKVDNQHLVADVEGLALASDGASGGYLVASSQGDNAYVLYRLPDMTPAGRFRIGAGQFGATQETDGIAVSGGNFGPLYPNGLIVAQDGDNAPNAQNFKLVSWATVMAALETPR